MPSHIETQETGLRSTIRFNSDTFIGNLGEPLEFGNEDGGDVDFSSCDASGTISTGDGEQHDFELQTVGSDAAKPTGSATISGNTRSMDIGAREVRVQFP